MENKINEYNRCYLNPNSIRSFLSIIIHLFLVILIIITFYFFLSLKPPSKLPKVVNKNNKKLHDPDEPGSVPPPKDPQNSDFTP